MYMKKSYRHRCINYNHRGSCEPFWFCTCTWTCCTSEAVASQHQPQSPRLLACSAVMWHTWQLEEKLLSTVSTPRTQQARRHCTWWARSEWHCFRQCKKTQATITSSRVCSGVIKHCHDRGRDQGRSRPSAALHVVCTNRVALLQRLLCWPTVWRPHHDHVRRRAHSCRTSMRRPSGWLWGLSSPFCAPRRSMVQADASHQRTTSAAASLPYIDDTSPLSMPSIWVQSEHSFAYLCKNSNISSIFFGTEKTARFFSHEAVKMFSLFGALFCDIWRGFFGT